MIDEAVKKDIPKTKYKKHQTEKLNLLGAVFVKLIFSKIIMVIWL